MLQSHNFKHTHLGLLYITPTILVKTDFRRFYEDMPIWTLGNYHGSVKAYKVNLSPGLKISILSTVVFTPCHSAHIKGPPSRLPSGNGLLPQGDTVKSSTMQTSPTRGSLPSVRRAGAPKSPGRCGKKQ
jgi:hypothetical protein